MPHRLLPIDTRKVLAATLVALIAGAAQAGAADEFDTPAAGKVRVETVARGLDHPWSVAFLPDGRYLVTERSGALRIVSKDGRLSPPLKGVPQVYAYGQGGLLDVVLDTDFARNGLIFLSYAEPGADGGGTAVARARLAGDTLQDVRVIWRMTPKTSGGRHFGSRIVIARDGTLFVTVGERGERPRAQDPSINRGQVVRINKDGSIPKDNPFVNRTGYRPEIWSYGHRNPQGAALNPATGELWTNEHGARGGDELNIPKAGGNYGWPVISYGRHYWGGRIGEGTKKAGMEQPIYYWDPSIAPSGMAFYTGERIPEWKGSLFVGSLKFRMLVRLEISGNKVVKEHRLLTGIDQRIRDVRQGPDGYLYLLTDESDGRLLRLRKAK